MLLVYHFVVMCSERKYKDLKNRKKHRENEEKEKVKRRCVWEEEIKSRKPNRRNIWKKKKRGRGKRIICFFICLFTDERAKMNVTCSDSLLSLVP